MDLQNCYPFKKTFYNFIGIIIFTTLLDKILSVDPKYEACAPQNCGSQPNISFPFWISSKQESYCGYPNLEITCDNGNPALKISNDDFIVKDVFKNQSFLLINAALSTESCPTPLHNFSLQGTPFSNSSSLDVLCLFYHCTGEPPDYSMTLNCASNYTHVSFAVFAKDLPSGSNSLHNSCQSWVEVPVDATGYGKNVTEMLKNEFVLNLSEQNCSDCEESGGRCGFDNTEFICFCPDRPYNNTCPSAKPHRRNWVVKTVIGNIYIISFPFLSVQKILLPSYNELEIITRVICPGVIAAFLGMGLMCTVFLIYQFRNRKRYTPSSLLSQNKSSDPSSVMESEKSSIYFGAHTFSYGELVEATNNFDPTKELGDGAFATVYHGKLRDGRNVAVKRLYENNCRRVEQFMNEVEILTYLRHQSLVSLYGCTSRHSRELLLVYEYIPNGTVADHLHGNCANAGSLTWPIRMSIAIESASALTYLHASDIIHRDVKTYNILLDNNFCVKVADFGLSRLFPTDVTHVSTAPQGTPGYVDPEYHQCYQLTDKSDVYSFGVVLIELISSKPPVDITRHWHEINLSDMAINKIQNNALHELVDPSLGFETDYKVRKMITAVSELAFRCLQKEKKMRPSMKEVLEGLKAIQAMVDNVEKAEEGDSLADDVCAAKE
ncbi:LEAF RUST 10 DISEASE-RESISTANCE LOCUS RECEPTOR-LIKE PROTEIN KINASE-like 1.2 [Malania oleifera]|uniref:LEAF RUST 10 DISEASE-RESISTANCE LOCUS RECEPTOR-LIKE PROTEIN KINASE-like 1.2 n=1 Tax=Malania oleifera TaxID=397392 RepID=UPI0025AE98B6|nr:LEAF RUST 10 DISEASE-RESISTANCE LOCUS RECEPTOR-LIKE PROTEIN KINASE-like 1.2 [Malania oleifera]